MADRNDMTPLRVAAVQMISTPRVADNLAVAGASLGSDDVRVTGPGGYSQLATLVGVARSQRRDHAPDQPGQHGHTERDGEHASPNGPRPLQRHRAGAVAWGGRMGLNCTASQ